MRKVKCRRCNDKTPQDEAYKIVHVAKTGVESNRYYCTEQCYREEEKDKFMLKQCQYAVDHILGYTVINNAKNSNIKEITQAGYTREQLFDCMLELKNYIVECLNYRKDIESEYQKIQYIFAIVKGQIKEITERNKIVEKKVSSINNEDYMDYIEGIERQETKQEFNKRKTLSDMLGGK